MIIVEEVVVDTDMADPEPYVVQRTLGQWQNDGFVNVQTTSIPVIAAIRVTTDKELQMLPEADRVGQQRTFYAPFPMLTVRGTAPTPSTVVQTLTGDVPGTTYILSAAPQGGAGNLFKNGVLLRPGVDYQLTGVTIVLTSPTVDGDKLWFSSPVVVNLQAANSDVILYDGLHWRVMHVYSVSGSGFWRAVATRMEAA